jgi:hypothetical protein
LAEFPTLEDFEREFPSLCFALATGVGKTRLMGAFISYLHLVRGFKHFFIFAANDGARAARPTEDYQREMWPQLHPRCHLQ